MSRFFCEDQVYRVNKRGVPEYGIVVRTAASSDLDSESDRDDDERPASGQVLVAWGARANETLVSEKKISLSDRALMPGDIVRRTAASEKSQRGYCRNVSVTCVAHVRHSRHVLLDVRSDRLAPPYKSFRQGEYVSLDRWVGLVLNVNYDLTLLFADGSRCVLPLDDVEMLDDSDPSIPCDADIHYFTGRRLQGSMRRFAGAKWLHCTAELHRLRKLANKLVKVSVVECLPVLVMVNWLYSDCGAPSGTSNNYQSPPSPPMCITGDHLQRVCVLNMLEPSRVQLGDIACCRLTEDQLVLSQQQWRWMDKDSLLSQQQQQQQRLRQKETGDCSTCHCAGKQRQHGSGDVSTHQRSNTRHRRHNQRAHKSRPTGDSHLPATSSPRADSSQTGSRVRCCCFAGASANEGSGDELGASCTSGGTCSRAGGGNAQSSGAVRMKTASARRRKLRHSRRGSHHHHHLHQQQQHETMTSSSSSVPSCQYAGDNLPRPGDQLIVTIIKTQSSVCVVWQDGSVDENISSAELYPIHHVDEHDFFPGDFVQWHVSSANSAVSVNHGVVQTADHAARTATVHWYRLPPREGASDVSTTLTADSIPQLLEQTESSVYDIGDHASYQLSAGTVVLKLTHLNTTTDSLTQSATDSLTQSATDSLTQLVTDSLTQPATDSLTQPATDSLTQSASKSATVDVSDAVSQSVCHVFAGQVEHVATSGLVSVCWTDGSVTQCYPHMLFRVGEYDWAEESLFEEFGGVQGVMEGVSSVTTHKHRHSSSSSEWETQSDEISCTEPGNDDNDEDDGELAPDDDETAAKSDKHDEQSLSSEHHPASGDSKQPGNQDLMNIDGDICGAAATVTSITDVQPGPASNQQELASLGDSGGFAVLDDVPADHSFVTTESVPENSGAFCRAVRREMKLLSSSLPPGIAVRGFQQRMDLLCVLIAGPCRTPYAGALFQFDVRLPDEYPRRPPLLQYVSRCVGRLNPNLYEDGKVCVSLLGTWSGRGSEVWCSRSSSLLQVLVSIQGLILVSEPYYNEAGYERQRGDAQAAENSRLYNEMVLVKVVQSTSNMVNNIPVVFFQEILQHIRLAMPGLIKRLQRWLELPDSAATMPASGDEDSLVPEFVLLPMSRGCRLALKKSLSHLIEAVTLRGLMPCSEDDLE